MMENIDDIPIQALTGRLKKSYVDYLSYNIDNEDISEGQFPFLMILNKKDNITQKELADNLFFSEGLITRGLKKLEENLYIVREVNKNNKRENIIKITPKGKKLALKLEYYKDKWEKDTFSFLTDEEFLNLKLILKKAINNSFNLNK